MADDTVTTTPAPTNDRPIMSEFKRVGFLEGAPGEKSTNRLIAASVTFILLFMVVAVQGVRVYQDLKTGKPIELLDVNFSIVLLLLAAYSPKIAETVSDIITAKLKQ